MLKDWVWNYNPQLDNIVTLLPILQSDIEFIENSWDYNHNECIYHNDEFIYYLKPSVED